jgi:protein-disulfide isomerase
VEYGDFECPYCRAAEPIVTGLIEALGDQLSVTFRHFPLSQVHPHARRAAEVAEAAASQGKFWEMHDTLYARQDALDDADLLKYAAELSLDSDRVSRELAGHEYARRVEEDQLSGLDSGVSSTPTFYIDGTRYDRSAALRDMLAGIRQLHPDLETGDTAASNPRIPRVRWPRAQRTVARRRD